MRQKKNSVVRINSIRVLVYLFACCLALFVPSLALAQESPKDDSITDAFQQKVNADRLAVGMDTTPVLNNPNDTLKKQAKPFGFRSGPRHKFYWNPARYDYSDSSLQARKARRHSPLYASLFSMALPGLGQAYNRKYWKIPIVYAGLGGLGYACYFTASNFVGYRRAYRAQVAEVPDPFASYKGVDDAATLKEYRDYFKKNLDISAICTGVWYILNVVDAAVDAHLFEWNMKDDINLSWQPVMLTNTSYATTAPGLRLNLSF